MDDEADEGAALPLIGLQGRVVSHARKLIIRLNPMLRTGPKERRR
jgi:hypothetical protein